MLSPNARQKLCMKPKLTTRKMTEKTARLLNAALRRLSRREKLPISPRYLNSLNHVRNPDRW